jgi:ATP-dependent DNA ligase
LNPWLLQRTQSLPEGPDWAYEVKLDGYRAVGIKSSGKVLLRFRNNKDFSAKYPANREGAQCTLPDETVVDGEVVALDTSGCPSFNALQNAGSSRHVVVYCGTPDSSRSGMPKTRSRCTETRGLRPE